jgi:hypothetical protein
MNKCKSTTARRGSATRRRRTEERALRRLPCTHPDARWIEDWIPYGLGIAENGDEIAFAHGYAPLWRYCPATGEITALDPDCHIPTTNDRIFRGYRLHDYDWKALDRVKARWAIRSW